MATPEIQLLKFNAEKCTNMHKGRNNRDNRYTLKEAEESTGVCGGDKVSYMKPTGHFLEAAMNKRCSMSN